MYYVKYDRTTNQYIHYSKDDNSSQAGDSPKFYLVDGNKYYSQSGLQRQGLKPKEISKLKPSVLLPNPKYPGKGNMKLYDAKTVDKMFPC